MLLDVAQCYETKKISASARAASQSATAFLPASCVISIADPRSPQRPRASHSADWNVPRSPSAMEQNGTPWNDLRKIAASAQSASRSATLLFTISCAISRIQPRPTPRPRAFHTPELNVRTRETAADFAAFLREFEAPRRVFQTSTFPRSPLFPWTAGRTDGRTRLIYASLLDVAA